jgi:hypothetical protein
MILDMRKSLKPELIQESPGGDSITLQDDGLQEVGVEEESGGDKEIEIDFIGSDEEVIIVNFL